MSTQTAADPSTEEAAKDFGLDPEMRKGLDAYFKHQFKEELPSIMDDRIEKSMKEKGMTPADLKNGNIPVNGMDPDTKSSTKEQRIGEFIKSVFKKDVGAYYEKYGMKAHIESVDSQGGFLVPEEWMSEISRITEDFGVIRTLARKVPMGSDTLNVPTTDTSVTTAWPGEGNAGTESTAVFGSVKMRTETQVGLATISNEMLADSRPAIVQHLNELFAEAFAGEEDEQGLNGVGAPFTGLLQESNVNAVTLASGGTGFTDVTLPKLRNMQSKIKQSVSAGGVYVMHREIWSTIQEIQENSQTVFAIQNTHLPVIGKDTTRKGIVPAGILWGKPVYLSDKMPNLAASAVSTKFIVYGNFNAGLYLGDRERMTMRISEDATVGSVNVFQNNMQAVRMTERVAINIVQPTAFVTLATAAS